MDAIRATVAVDRALTTFGKIVISVFFVQLTVHIVIPGPISREGVVTPQVDSSRLFVLVLRRWWWWSPVRAHRIDELARRFEVAHHVYFEAPSTLGCSRPT